MKTFIQFLTERSNTDWVVHVIRTDTEQTWSEKKQKWVNNVDNASAAMDIKSGKKMELRIKDVPSSKLKTMTRGEIRKKYPHLIPKNL